MQWRLAGYWRTPSPDWRVIALMAFAASLLSGPDSFRGAPAARASVRGAPSGVTTEVWSRPMGDLAKITEQLGRIDDLVSSALTDGKLPGCVVVIGQHDRVLFHKAYGKRALMPDPIEMTEDTVFDLASLTKPVATATAVMILAERHKLELDERIDHYVPECGALGQSGVTLRHLLTHVSGLPAETPFDDYEHGRAVAIRRICAQSHKPPGEKFIYSDIGFILLEEAVRRASGQDFASFVQDAIFGPLGMTETVFLPSAELRQRAAPTEVRNNAFMVGEVHDPRAYRLGGVAGNAGLFSTARDMTRYARAMLGNGELDGARILSRESVRAMMARHDVPGGIRALGWDVRSRYSVNRGESFSRRAVGHGGFTGTALWMDPEEDAFVLFLSNRVHPDGKGSVNALVGQIGTLAASALAPVGERPYVLAANVEDAGSARTPVDVGVDVLRQTDFSELRGAHVGLVTNVTGAAHDGSRTIDLLRAAPDVTLVALFAPEHGLGTNRDQRISNDTDPASGLPVYSLYGDVFEPTPSMLEGIDTLVFDIQDAGARFYTYASTLHRVLRVGGARGLKVVVLDRPNPIGGLEVSGPLSTRDATSFVNHHPLPVRHGMTLGELAEMIDADEHLGVDLHVVKMSGWLRVQYFDETGLSWMPPSPNLRSIKQAVLYPGVALVEGTNVSVGRGTDTPFEVVGAPWIDATQLAGALQEMKLAGVTFEPAEFTPKTSAFAGQLCHGVRLEVQSRETFEPVRTGIAIALALRKLHPDAWHPDKLNQIIGNAPITDAILALRPLEEIEALWSADLAAFREKREKYLLY
jgi:uncharacterized protein YbbC (DUF1343 family)/CubicO group peptidase (beta-lactamase class C family)